MYGQWIAFLPPLLPTIALGAGGCKLIAFATVVHLCPISIRGCHCPSTVPIILITTG